MKTKTLIIAISAILLIVITVWALQNAKETITSTTTTTGETEHGGLLTWLSGIFSGAQFNLFGTSSS
ncbi:MAG: hypothetical protein Kow0068_20840 [Marinilabiliales bacterium]